eukprot:CAMPEP_0197290600 /NCGR_PEP_ID=MMETSP0890-20130614/8313_1 /TAXON_ID=44058 ORGANISM="Aureoumbra lagunensis, Strain CCMP1510" /NCGR_SAMPLE_ID=MMETSP0890 /ASSEMBLY_ACC=CAM_ASM_000533 /LENGTH=180 /DNA_ID=CAMNT_0042762691 /DNA_START=92 /DNA_END=634 /DNA_ORIENTATION=-
MLLLLVVGGVSSATAFGFHTAGAPVSGTWRVYNDSETGTPLAPLSCDNNTATGTKVDDSCCDNVDPYFSIVDYLSDANCKAGVFLPDGSAARPYIGCDDGVITYGELCREGNQPYPWPPGTDLDPLMYNASSVEDCGCEVYMQGPGCYKGTDLNEGLFEAYGMAPYFDYRQFFIKLEDCA